MDAPMNTTTVATVVDDRPPYIDEVVCLFASLERFGGRLRAAQRRAYLVNDVPAETGDRLEALGVDVRTVPEIDRDYRLANKLSMFAAEATECTGLLVALDTDIVVAGDITPYLDTGVLQAKQVDGDLLTLEAWHELFDRFGLTLPSERHPPSLYPGWTHAYFNTGVLMIPGAVLRSLYDRWLSLLKALIELVPAMPAVAHLTEDVPSHGTTSRELRHLFYVEQWAFSLAVQALGIPYAVLPLALNFPLTYNVDQRPGHYIRERFVPHGVEPLLVHHHHQLGGGLSLSGYKRPDEVIEQVNEALFAGHGPAAAGPG